MVHNLWSWSSGMLRSFLPTLSDGVAKRNCHGLLMQSLLLVTGRRLGISVSHGVHGHEQGTKMWEESFGCGAMRDLKRYGTWLLAEHAYFWVVQHDASRAGLYDHRYLHISSTATAAAENGDEEEERSVTYDM